MRFPSTLLPQSNNPQEIQKSVLDLLAKLNQIVGAVDTADRLTKSNPILPAGTIGYETDTLSYKIGDGKTAYNSLVYAYRGLPAKGESSLGTSHKHSNTVVSSAPVDTNVHSIQLTAWPIGTKSVEGYIEASSGTAGHYLTITDSTGAEIYGRARVYVATITGFGYFKALLEGDRMLYYKTSAATLTSIGIVPNFYDI